MSLRRMIVLVLILSAGAVVCEAQHAAVGGVVRDKSGVPQMGALVQVFGTGSVELGHAVTDLTGHFLISNLQAGNNYQIRASAALFMPTARSSLKLRQGMQAEVMLTLRTLFDTTSWLPPASRSGDDPLDDWKWTLRSAAHRPVLRVVNKGQIVLASSSATEQSKPETQMRASVIRGDGGFGTGGSHSVVTMARISEDGGQILVRTDIAAATPVTAGSLQTAVGYERQLSFASSARAVMVAQAHPELQTGADRSGVQSLSLYSAHRTQMGDFLLVEAGGNLEVIHAVTSATVMHPFARLEFTPGQEWAIGYLLADDRQLQSYADLDAVRRRSSVAAMSHGKLVVPSGRHHELSVARKVGSKGSLRAAVYHDTLPQIDVAGNGILPADELAAASNAGLGMAIDGSTATFRLMAAGYSSNGWTVLYTQPLNGVVTASVEYGTGSALTRGMTNGQDLASIAAGLKSERAQQVTGTVTVHSPRTGTRLRASYRWQPAHLVSAVNPYGDPDSESYASVHLRQTIHFAGLLPPGFALAFDVNNMFGQGYELVGSGPVFLAQSPRAVQGGVQFSF